jgi:hypothetical protein
MDLSGPQVTIYVLGFWLMPPILYTILVSFLDYKRSSHVVRVCDAVDDVHADGVHDYPHAVYADDDDDVNHVDGAACSPE